MEVVEVVGHSQHNSHLDYNHEQHMKVEGEGVRNEKEKMFSYWMVEKVEEKEEKID